MVFIPLLSKQEDFDWVKSPSRHRDGSPCKLKISKIPINASQNANAKFFANCHSNSNSPDSKKKYAK